MIALNCREIYCIDFFLSTEHHWPFLVSLQKWGKINKKYLHMCGGSILNEFQVLTAAHCFDGKWRDKNPSNWIILAGKKYSFTRPKT